MKIKEHNPNWPYIPDHPYRINNRRLRIWKNKCITNFNK